MKVRLLLGLVSVVGLWGCGDSAPEGSPGAGGSSSTASAASGGATHTGAGGGDGGGGQAGQQGAGGGTSNPDGIKLHGGSYAWPDLKFDDTYSTYRLDHDGVRQKLLDFIETIKDEPSIRGVQVVMYWRAMEGDTPGDYSAGFDALDIVLDKLAQYGKHLNLSFQPQVFGGFGSLNDVFPQYVIDDYGMTQVGFYGYGGMTARTWQTATMDQIIRVVEAYGERYDKHPAFESLTSSETSLQVPDGTDGFSNQALLEQFLRLIPAARAAFPHSVIRLGANDMTGDDSLLLQLFDACETSACAVGGPDIWPGDITQADRVFAGLDSLQQPAFEDRRDSMPWHVEAQWQSFVGNKGYHWTMDDLFGAVENGYSAPMCDANDPVTYACTHTFDFQLPSMKPRYITWYVNTYEQDEQSLTWEEDILPYLRTHTPSHATVCPASYAAFGGCNTD